jgi:hypothetical protein
MERASAITIADSTISDSLPYGAYGDATQTMSGIICVGNMSL